jgi:hypothetical protein
MRYRSSRKPPRSDISWIFFYALSAHLPESTQTLQLCTGLGLRHCDALALSVVSIQTTDAFLGDVVMSSHRISCIDTPSKSRAVRDYAQRRLAL